MSLSSISMACNSSGPLNTSIAKFGIVSVDWSNEKAMWAIQRPMDCEERLVTQAQILKAANPASNVFSYRNLVKALPWFSTVRAKLLDPAYSGFFINFKAGGSFPNGSYHVPNCDANYSPEICSVYYHDQVQTPEVTSPSNPNPDGACIGTCDCGEGLPCGEYYWDHRNGTMLQDFLIQEVLLGPNGLGNDAINGMFIDDFWCANLLNGSGSCTDPAQGPTEVDPHFQEDTGLSDQEILDITEGWLSTMTAAQAALLAAGGYTWSLIPGQANANAAPLMISDPQSCLDALRPSCRASSPNPWAAAPLMYGIDMGTTENPLPQLQVDIAAFLLMRGPFAYIGAGFWGMSWPIGSSFTHNNTPLSRPIEMDTDYGAPSTACTEGPAANGIFTRAYTKAAVSLDCKTLTANITMMGV